MKLDHAPLHRIYKKMSESDEKKSAASSGLSVAFVCFILNIVITKSASYDQFDVLGLGDRWDFHHFMMWTAVGLIIACLFVMWVACAAVVSENDTVGGLAGCLGGLAGLGVLAVLIIQYVKMGQLWHRDPEHTIFFYNEFWSEGITDMSIYNSTAHLHPTPQRLLESTTPSLRGAEVIVARRLAEHVTHLASEWVYVMSDVVIRIYGFGLMFIPFLLGIFVFCGGSAVCCGKCCSSKTNGVPQATMSAF